MPFVKQKRLTSTNIPFHVRCPECSGTGSQQDLTLIIQDEDDPVGTEDGIFAISCPVCGHNDSLGAPFRFFCPQYYCDEVFDRSAGTLEIWTDGDSYLLTVICPHCGHACGETED